MKTILSLFLFFLLILSCKKDKLKDDKEIFIGKWKWVSSVQTIRYNCDGMTYTSILTPSSEGVNYSMEFFKKGCVIFYKNDGEIDKYRVVFDENFQLNSGSYSEFEIHLNNKSENYFVGYIKSDTLIELGWFFPYKNGQNSCLSYKNYFVRE